MSTQEVSCGLEYYCAPDVRTSYSEAISNKYKFLALPVIHPRYRRTHTNGCSVVSNFTRSDLLLDSNDWTVRVVAKISSYLNVDSPCEKVRLRHEDCFIEELSYCRGLNVPAIMFSLKNMDNFNLARIVKNFFLTSHSPARVWVHVPMLMEYDQAFNPPSDSDNETHYDRAWLMWSKFHEILEYDKKVNVTLELPEDLPSGNVIARWLGEPVKCLLLPTHIFHNNKRGLPVLSPAHQKVVCQFIARDAQILIGGAQRSPVVQYPIYMDHLWEKRSCFLPNAMMKYAKGYEDFPQIPLQPLADNLETTTYDVFEKDPIKYSLYQKAVEKALIDLKQQDEELSKDASGDAPEDTAAKVYTVMVLGAGRGPLVWSCLNAADKTKTQIQIYAVEKNPCAVVTLEAQVRETWRGRNVKVFAGDMRRVKLDTKADIIVSELLGSWSDNELSPECLDGAMRLLKPGGISIPTSYTSFAAPITAPYLWASVKNGLHSNNISFHPDKNHETLWVVYLQNKYDISDNKEVFTFVHPSRGAIDHEGNEMKDHEGTPLPDNRRSAVIKWTAQQDAVMHGFAGYFDCVLYGDVTMSILPETHSTDMISWFPVFIPIKAPLRVRKGEEITAWFWRCVNSRKVWYEWSVRVGQQTTPLHNPNGRSYEMLL